MTTTLLLLNTYIVHPFRHLRASSVDFMGQPNILTDLKTKIIHSYIDDPGKPNVGKALFESTNCSYMWKHQLS